MDDPRFDRLTKALAAAPSRRRLLAALAGGFVAAVAPQRGKMVIEGAPICNPRVPIDNCDPCIPVRCAGLCGLHYDDCLGEYVDCGCCRTTSCAAQGAQCGSVWTGCEDEHCGECPICHVCSGTACVPQAPTSCEALGAQCGSVWDGCQEVTCGPCPACQQCFGTACVPNPPPTCGGQCGSVSDGCQTISCSCPAGQCCVNGACRQRSTTCTAGSCGTFADGCGGTFSCSCPAGQTCSGGRCICQPTTCAAEGKNCGTIPDGCGGSLPCGTCVGPETCGGGETANVCGRGPCTPNTTCEPGACGTFSDGCTKTFTCSCPSGQTCSGGRCVTEPVTPPTTTLPRPPDCTGSCGGRECGSVPDNCGGTHFCGSCPSGHTCSGGQCVEGNPPCIANLLSDPANCGECGNACADGYGCTGGACVRPGTAAGGGPEASPSAGPAHVVLVLAGIGSSSLLDDSGHNDPANHLVRDLYALTVERLRQANPNLSLYYYSYRLARLLERQQDPFKAWTRGGFGADVEPVYRPSDVTDWALDAHVTGLAWQVDQVLERDPEATIDVLGHGAGALVALHFVAGLLAAEDERLEAVRRILVVNTPLRGLNPQADDAVVLPELKQRNLDLGNGALLRSILSTSPAIVGLTEAAKLEAVWSFENPYDYFVNGEPVEGVELWLGKGSDTLVPTERRLEVKLVRNEADFVWTTNLPFEDRDPWGEQARKLMAEALAP